MRKVIAAAIVTAIGVAGFAAWRAADTVAADPPGPQVDASGVNAIPEYSGKVLNPVRSQEWLRQASTASKWALPANNRLPGVSEVTLASSLEDWIQSLPLGKQEAARSFAGRYAVGYQIQSKAQLAWMIDNGFPSLEEVASFDFDRHASECKSLDCGNAKVSALAADHMLQEIESLVPSEVSDAVEIPDYSETLSEEQRVKLVQISGEVRNYIERSRDNGSTLFAAYLTAKLAQLTGDVERAEVAYSFAAACGDPRALDFGSDSTVAVATTLSMAQGGYRACGVQTGTPKFPHSY